ncbi:universal stress protein [Streptomyces sp. N35]|uniref:universal stress protein n=1 Tax=Streptomyces sp. N35 TaxID=2795730 RepID=UPI0018F68B95|nr:universal stress protein [Streptomyces sp. N35]
MELPIVVGVDGSDASLRAVDWAVSEAGLRGLPLRIVYADVRARPGKGAAGLGSANPPDRDAARRMLERAARRAQGAGTEAKISTEAVGGDAVETLLDEARHAAALITGCRGRDTFVRLGRGINLSLAARAACPLIVVRGDATALSARHRRVVLGLGEAPVARPVVEFAFGAAEARNAVLEAVRAWRAPAHELRVHPLIVGDPPVHQRDRAVQLLEDALRGPAADHPKVVVRRAAVEGRVDTVLRTRSTTADLLVIGAKRHYGRTEPSLGRRIQALLQNSACPVAVVPHSP